MGRGPDPARLSATALLALALGACASAAPPPPRPLVVFPPPPDTARIQFLARYSDTRDVESRKGPSFLGRLIGKDREPEEGSAIVKPYGVAIHSGRIYVCDTMAGGVEVLDLAAHRFEFRKPRGLGQLRKPINCFVADDGELYVAYVDREQVVVFDSAGAYAGGFGDGADFRPTDVFVDPDRVWVADIGGRKVRVFDRGTRRLLRSFPTDTVGPGVLFQPTNLFVADDRVYVTDFGDFRVKVFTRDGEYVRSVGSYGRSLGQFVRPKGIAVDREGRLYVVDAGFENVQVFDPAGKLLMFFGGSYDGPGYMWLPAKVVVDYDNLALFRPFVHEGFDLDHLVIVTNQYGPDKVTVYGFVRPRAETDGTP